MPVHAHRDSGRHLGLRRRLPRRGQLQVRVGDGPRRALRLLLRRCERDSVTDLIFGQPLGQPLTVRLCRAQLSGERTPTHAVAARVAASRVAASWRRSRPWAWPETRVAERACSRGGRSVAFSPASNADTGAAAAFTRSRSGRRGGGRRGGGSGLEWSRRCTSGGRITHICQLGAVECGCCCRGIGDGSDRIHDGRRRGARLGGVRTPGGGSLLIRRWRSYGGVGRGVSGVRRGRLHIPLRRRRAGDGRDDRMRRPVTVADHIVVARGGVARRRRRSRHIRCVHLLRHDANVARLRRFRRRRRRNRAKADAVAVAQLDAVLRNAHAVDEGAVGAVVIDEAPRAWCCRREPIEPRVQSRCLARPTAVVEPQAHALPPPADPDGLAARAEDERLSAAAVAAFIV